MRSHAARTACSDPKAVLLLAMSWPHKKMMLGLSTPCDSMVWHVQVFDTAVDHLCPQQQPLQIVRCQAHQHFGARCMELIDLANNHTICRSCPIFGTEQGVPGNELGYVVDEEQVDVMPPYVVQPGAQIRIQVSQL